jgi:hypothetical protein
MSRRTIFKQADVTRALRGTTAAGLKPSGFRIDPVTGKIEVQIGNDNAPAGNSFDRLIGPR